MNTTFYSTEKSGNGAYITLPPHPKALLRAIFAYINPFTSSLIYILLLYRIFYKKSSLNKNTAVFVVNSQSPDIKNVGALILVLATSYLPRRWPAKYFYRYESLRPCSGWVRVVYSRLVTSDSFALRWKLHNDYKLSQSSTTFLVWVPFLLLLWSLQANSYVAIVVFPCSSHSRVPTPETPATAF